MALDDAINWSNFYQAYTGLRFSIRKDKCNVFVPTYKNVLHSNIPSLSGTDMAFQDEWSSHAFLATGNTDKINEILLKDLYEYASGNILWDEFTEKLSFVDIEVAEVTLEDFVKDVESFLVFHKLSKFGNVWWVGRVASDMEGKDTAFANVFVPNKEGFVGPGATNQISFWSADKHVNDEFKRYSSNPLSYSGFLTSDDFNNGGWFTVPDLKLSTKPFEKLKIAQILLNLNFTFDPKNHFGHYYAIESRLGSRIKDLTSGAVLDVGQSKSGQNSSSYTDSLVNHWIGGLVSSSNIQNLGEVGKFSNDTCSPPPAPLPTEISHAIAGQITLNPEFSPTKRDQLGTIDSINWRSSESTVNAHNIGVLNTDRSFGGANGTIDGGLVFGGVHTNNSGSYVLDNVEIWNGLGFLKNVQTSANAPRCFHVQGGFGGKTLAALGGFTTFNTDDYIQFGEYGKAGVRNDMEVFIKSDDANLSYFKKVPNFSLTTGRGDAAGSLTVSIQDRVDKFVATSALQGFPSDKNNEQTIADFINSKSGQDNAKRYTVVNINGIIFGGSSTGNQYMSTTANSDILDSFEKISTVFIDVGITNTGLISPSKVVPIGQCQAIIKDVITVAAAKADGEIVVVEKCGKYRLTYLNGAGQRGAPVVRSGGRKKRGFGGGAFGGSAIGGFSLPGLPSIDDVANEVHDLIPGPPTIPGLPPLPPLPLDLFGTDKSHLGNNPYSPRMRVYVNEQKVSKLAFNVPDQGTEAQLQKYFQSHPGFETYDFCVSIPNSTIRIIFDDIDPAGNTGYINVQMCYLGQIDSCGCKQEEILDVTSVAVSYSRVDPNLTYPVSVHGLCYVGTEKHGLATGGRCEKNIISNVEALLLQKYSLGYDIGVDFSQPSSELEQNRVLDLAYKFDGTTWIRQQNLLESVYYHTGVGDDNHAIFWGGIHDSLATFHFSYSNAVSAAPTPQFSSWNCSNKEIKLVTQDVTNGVGYPSDLNSSACWQSPTWTSVAATFFDNPLFVDKVDASYLTYSRDADFPQIEVISLSPDSVKTFTQQTFTNLQFGYPTTSSFGVSATPNTNNTFNVRAITISGNSTLTGTWSLSNLELVFDETSIIYPNNVNISAGFTNEIKNLSITEINGTTDSVDLAYNLSHFFNYIDSSTAMTSAFGIRGVGTLSFNSLNDIWVNSVSGNSVISTTVNTMLIVSTAADTIDAFYINGKANALFTMPDTNGLMVGVETTKNTWASSMESCGDNITSFLNINAKFGQDYIERWGVPLWNSAFDRSGSLFLMYNFDVRNSASTSGAGFDDYQITTVSASAGSVAAIVNNRILIKGSTHEQHHEFAAINNVSITPITSNCEHVTNSTVAVFTTPLSGQAYTEWASSFVQEYRNDERFRVPEVWTPSNGYGVIPENTGILHKSSSWKRYMDGVGLGGDAPDYDTIVNGVTKKGYGVSNWNEIGKWLIGQMAFGTPQRAIIVGGHKVNRTAGNGLVGSGLHANNTSKRVFVWDFNSIPEEDAYLTNYLGRRFHTFFSNSSNSVPISGNENRSDLNCVIFDAESNIVVERFGTAVFDGSTQEVTVAFDNAMPQEASTTYSVSLTPDDNVEVWWAEKTVSGFKIKTELNGWKGRVDYLATAVIKVTEQDIEQKGQTDGYIFNK